ncbi:hypothetical protein ACQEU6_42130 [Spirillospora sp. CA-108201]
MRDGNSIPGHVRDSSVVFDGSEDYIEDADLASAGDGAGEDPEVSIGLQGEAQRLINSQ